MPERRTRSASPDRTYWILARPQIECLASPRRQDVLDRLAAAGPCPVREFAGAIGLAPSAVYHHLRRLEAAGLVRVAGTRVVRRRTEKLYEAVAPRMRMARALGRPATRAPVRKVVSALCRQMDRDFARGHARPEARPDGAARNLGFFRLVGTPGPRALAEINRHLDRIAELLWTRADTSAAPVAFAWTMAPVGRPARRAPTRRRNP